VVPAGAHSTPSTSAFSGPIEVKDAAGVDLRRLSDDEVKELEGLLLRASPEPVWSPDADDA
jgi:hypothetical protein